MFEMKQSLQLVQIHLGILVFEVEQSLQLVQIHLGILVFEVEQSLQVQSNTSRYSSV